MTYDFKDEYENFFTVGISPSGVLYLLKNGESVDIWDYWPFSELPKVWRAASIAVVNDWDFVATTKQG